MIPSDLKYMELSNVSVRGFDAVTACQVTAVAR